jgi:hypothetical protein
MGCASSTETGKDGIISKKEGNKKSSQKDVLYELIEYKYGDILEEKVLKGTSPDKKDPLEPAECDIIGGDVAILTLTNVEKNYCFNDGRYNNSDFKAEMRVLTSSKGKEYPAITIHPGATKPTEGFCSATNALYHKFETVQDSTILSYDGFNFSIIAEVKAADISATDFTKVMELDRK